MLLKDLSNLPGISGNEDHVRNYILNEIKPYCDSVSVDRIGNIISVVKAAGGKNGVPKIMLCAHMDEVGLIVSGIDKNGHLKFMPVGGIDPKVLPGCRVLVGEQDIKGVIGLRAIHLQSEIEFKKVQTSDMLRIDIGSENKRQTEKLVELGDAVTFDTLFEEFGDDLYAGKAFDDRVGCAVLIELLRNMKRPAFDLYVCFSTREEIGLAGAKVLTNQIQPEIAVILEGTTCADLPGVSAHLTSSQLRKGPVLTRMDGASVSSPALNHMIEKAAVSNHIPFQYKNTISGGNDAGAVQKNASAVHVASISVPCRYIHSPVSVISKQDYDNTFYLLSYLIEELSLSGGKLHV